MRTLKGIPALLAGGCLAAAAATAAAQDYRALPPPESIVSTQAPATPSSVQFDVGIVGRVSLPSGTVESQIPLHYNDLFGTGYGFSVEGSALFPIGPKWHLGPYLSVGWDSFGGKTFTDSTGDTLTPDRLTDLTVLVGARSLLDLGHHFGWEAHVGLGAASTSAVDAVFVTGGVPLDTQLFKSSTVFAADFGTRFTYDVGQVFFQVGLGVRTQSSPKESDFAFNSGPLTTVEFEFGAGIRF
jgi:hypothetical protein